MQSRARHKSCLRGIKEHVRSQSAHQASKTLSLALVFARFRANIKHCTPRLAHSYPMSQHNEMSGEGWVKVVQIKDKSQI